MRAIGIECSPFPDIDWLHYFFRTRRLAISRCIFRRRFRLVKASSGFQVHRRRRDIVPLWSSPSNESEATPPAPLVPSSQVFIKPQLSPLLGRVEDFLIQAYVDIFG